MAKLEVLKSGGAVVLAKQFRRDSDEEVLLCLLPENDVTPFVTWERRIGGNPEATFTGYYFATLPEAYENWQARAGL